MIAAFAQRARLLASSLALTLAAPAVMATPVPAHIVAPAAERAARESAAPQTAIFAGGPFGAAEAVFSRVAGVSSAVSGYAAPQRGLDPLTRLRGARPHGDPRPIEAVRLTYDPAKIRYDVLLRIYLTAVVDPTQRDGHGAHPGAAFRSALVPTSQEQLLVASAYLSQLRASGLWPEPIATRIEPARRFTAANAAQKDVLTRSPDHPEIARLIALKLAVLRQHFPQVLADGFTPD